MNLSKEKNKARCKIIIGYSGGLVCPHDSASVHACAYLVQAKTLEPSVLFLESAVIFSNVFEPQKHLKIPS